MGKLTELVEVKEIPEKVGDMLYQEAVLNALDNTFSTIETTSDDNYEESVMEDYYNLETSVITNEKIAVFLAFVLKNPYLQAKFLQNILDFIKDNEEDELKIMQTINTTIEFFQNFIDIHNKKDAYLVPILQYNLEKDICEILSKVELTETNLQLIEQGYPILLENGLRVHYMNKDGYDYFHPDTGATYVGIVDSEARTYMIDETGDILYDDEGNMIKSILFPLLLDNTNMYFHVENTNEEQYVVDENMCVLRVCGERVDRMDKGKLGKFDSTFSFCALYTAAGTLIVDEDLVLITIDYIKAYLSGSMKEFHNSGKAADVLFYDDNIPSLYEKEMVEDILDFVDIKGQKLMKIKTISYSEEGDSYVQYYVNKDLVIFKDSKGYFITNILGEEDISGQSFLLFGNGDSIVEGMIDLDAKVIEFDKKSIFSIEKLSVKINNEECYKLSFVDGTSKRIPISVLKNRLVGYKSIPTPTKAKIIQMVNRV